MNSSLYTGVLGLQNHQIAMDVIGNNIANINTYGFKKGRAEFADLLSRTYMAASAPRGNIGGTNPMQVGMGMTTVSVTNLMLQGQIENTGRATDVAISGNGWFVLQDANGNTVYTRDGTFGLDRDGTLVNNNGFKIQGWTRVETTHNHDFVVDTQRPVTDINFQIGEKLSAQATNQVGLKCNLKSDSRSIIADGLDPKEGYATKDDTLVDLYKLDAGEYTPEHLGIREGDWIEIKAEAFYNALANNNEFGAWTTATGTAAAGQQRFSLIGASSLPVEIADQGGFSIQIGATQYLAANRVSVDPDTDNDGVVDNLAANQWVYNSKTGEVIVGTAAALNDPVTINYRTRQRCENTMPFQTEKYYYFQVTNDTDIADLETAIQNTLNALDVNGTINAEVKYNTDDAQFYIYNNPVSNSQDWNEIKVSINAASGSAIRQGFILQDSTDKTVNGTRLSLVTGGLGGNMQAENLGIIDYQTDTLKLAYGDVDNSEQIYAQVVNTRLSTSYNPGVQGGALALNEWTTGYTQGNALRMINQTDKLSVDGTYWTRVDFFSGAANEYVISDANGTATPVIYFNTAAGLAPAANSTIVLEFRPSNATVVQLTENTGYTIDSSTGNISLMWSGANTNPNRALMVNGAGLLTGQIKITAQYTTEKRLLAAPSTIMNSRWADFAQAYAEVSEGGDGKARTDFNNMWGTINNKIGSTPDPIIYDQATSTQPTQKASSRFLSAETHRTSINVYDSLGAIHELQFVFTHVGSYYDTAKQIRYTNQWFWRAELPYSDVFAFDSMDKIDALAQGVGRLKGSLTFDDNGLLQATALAGNTGPIMFDPSPIGLNGNSTRSVDTLSIEVDFDGHTTNLLGGVTQYASDSTTLAYEQNGWAMGILQTFAVDQLGIIQGSYSNGVVKPIGQLALAIFPNEEGLTKLGANLWDQSANSGTPTLVPAYVGGAGSVMGGALEMSNVDIAEEFTKMIITERGFQANSRIITTSDEMLTEVLNLKR